MKIPELFVTFIYRHQLVDLWDRQALRSKRLKKLNNGLTIALLKPKYLTRRIYFFYPSIVRFSREEENRQLEKLHSTRNFSRSPSPH
jgi:hypothetical protein